MPEEDSVAKVKELMWEPIREILPGDSLALIVLVKEGCLISDWAFEEIMERSLGKEKKGS